MPEPEATAVCAAACASLIGQGCLGTQAAGPAARECSEGCRARSDAAGLAGCTRTERAFLACVSTAKLDCGLASSTSAALEHGFGVSGCDSERAAYLACVAPCREQGIVRSGSRPLRRDGEDLFASVELEHLGCGAAPPSPRTGAPAGSLCQHDSVCRPVDCRCGTTKVSFRTRACVNGSCAAPNLACAIAEATVGERVCVGELANPL